MNDQRDSLTGRYQAVPPKERFWRKVTKTDGCWLFSDLTPLGYGKLRVGGRMVAAHRLAYEWLVGPIPEGLTLDHLCRVRSCVNPAHLEPVTTGENVRRGEGPAARNARMERCPKGHEFGRLGTQRRCLICMREYQRRWEWEHVRTGEGKGWHRLITHCPKGHIYDEENTYTRPGTNHRTCRACKREDNKLRKQVQRAAERAARN